MRVSGLARVFGTSEVTIRHDLAELEEQGLLYRVHGGAESTHRAYCTLSLADRMKRNRYGDRRGGDCGHTDHHAQADRQVPADIAAKNVEVITV